MSVSSSFLDEELSLTGSRTGPSWRSVVLAVCALGVVGAAALHWWPRERSANMERSPAAERAETTTPVVASAAPATVNGVASDAPPASVPAPLRAGPPRPSYPAVQISRPAPQPPAPKHPDLLVPAAATPQVTKSANSAITDVGY